MHIRSRQLFLRDLLTALFRQVRLERNVFLLIVGGTFVVNWLLPTVYQSHATLLVSPQGATEASAAAAARDDAIVLLGDADFLLVAAERIGVPALLDHDAHASPLARGTGMGRAIGETLRLVRRRTETERAVGHLQRHLGVRPHGNERLIHITFRAADPAFAQTALRAVSHAFVNLHQRPAAAMQETDPVAQAETALQQFTAAHDPDELAEQSAALEARATRLREELGDDRTVERLQQLSDLDVELARTRELLDELQRLEDDVLALTASVELHGAAPPPPPAMTTGPIAFSIVTEASLPVLPISPNRARNMLHALWIGLLAAPLMGLLVQWLDHSLLFPEDLEQGMALPVLGSEFAEETAAQRMMHLQQICARLRQPPDDLPSQVWLITSAHEGTGTLPAEVAATLAEDPTARVLHLDLHAGAASGTGFGDVVLDRAPLDEALTQNGQSNLWQLARGAADKANPLYLASESSRRHWQALRDRFTDIVVSAPPILDASETVSVAARCDAVLLAVRAERVRREVVARACEILTHTQTRVGGAVLTNRRTYIPSWLYRRI